MRIDVVRLQVLSIDKTTRGRPHIAVTICMESRFAEVSGHGAIRQESPIKFELLHLLLDASFLLFGQLSVALSTHKSSISGPLADCLAIRVGCATLAPASRLLMAQLSQDVCVQV